jgi:hypothetical protein
VEEGDSILDGGDVGSRVAACQDAEVAERNHNRNSIPTLGYCSMDSVDQQWVEAPGVVAVMFFEFPPVVRVSQSQSPLLSMEHFLATLEIPCPWLYRRQSQTKSPFWHPVLRTSLMVPTLGFPRQC